MAQESLLKEILDTLENLDVVQLFATANGLVGDVEVECLNIKLITMLCNVYNTPSTSD